MGAELKVGFEQRIDLSRVSKKGTNITCIVAVHEDSRSANGYAVSVHEAWNHVFTSTIITSLGMPLPAARAFAQNYVLELVREGWLECAVRGSYPVRAALAPTPLMDAEAAQVRVSDVINTACRHGFQCR